MHLLAAKPGGYVDDEGIIDLDQSPGDIVFFSAADSQLAALADAVDRLPSDNDAFPTVRLVNWLQLKKPAAFDLYESKVLDQATVVVVSLLGGLSYWPYAIERLQKWAASSKHKQRKLIVVPGDDQPDPDCSNACNVPDEHSQRTWRYLRESGQQNTRSLLYFIASEYFAEHACSNAWQWREPVVLPKTLIYGLESNDIDKPLSLKQWQQRWQDKALQQKDLQHGKALLLFYRSHIQSANTGMFDQFIHLAEQQGLAVFPVAISSLKDKNCLDILNTLIEQSGAQVILNTTGFASNTVASPELSAEPTGFDSPFQASIPVLQLILSSSTGEDWQNYSQGLRARDIAMQVVLPEMDGRLITRAISFKTESHYAERSQISIVGYALHEERARFVIQLAKRTTQLSNKPNSQKRLAMILANYPTKDGRIGNGVGLDTPASAVNILNHLQATGFPVADIPETGNGLIEALLESITNNPNTLHQLPCWQSIHLDDYSRCFRQMPEAAQQAVLERWGAPEKDPKYRQSRIMIAGRRLGETFVGIQPARGFNVDLLANYHDPDLIPPHSYLAFYFWLREVYQVDAVVHVGKHGNLEWLPGKGTALSELCWPDIVLGPVPHFYPFIVNDPGEGAQAKRRTQATIIDHLMPPMSRAETYGEMAELEQLVDEYYQAMGLDERRETHLRNAILELATSSHLQK